MACRLVKASFPIFGSLLFNCLFAISNLSAQTQPPVRTVRFETTQGTAMNVDVSPDGKTIVFDLLGDLYTVPIRGGTATRLTHGPAFDTEPVFSPDGRRIAFVSDRSGSDNIWLMDANGRNVHAFTRDTTTAVTRPEWLTDNAFLLVARKGDSYWMYRPDGSGATIASLLPEGARPGPGDAAWSRDGRNLYTVGRQLIRRIDMARGVFEVLSERSRLAFCLAVSPDGQWVVFGSQQNNQTGLRILNVVTEEERWLISSLPDRDNSMLAEPSLLYAPPAPGTSWPPPALPRFAFMPDGKAIILATGGTLQRLDLRTGALQPIGFRATVEQELSPRVVVAHNLPSAPDSIRQPEPSGSIALEGATVITMRGDEILRDATVLVTGRRIAAVGPRTSVSLPVDVRRIDVSGKTIIPGLIDLRSEVPVARESLEETNVTLMANLAFGVTTVRTFVAGDVAANAPLNKTVQSAGFVETSAIGARVITDGTVTAAEASTIVNLDAARDLIRRQRAQGATAILQRVVLTRQQRQWLATAAREAGISIIGETGHLRLALTMIADGYAGIQGTIPNAQLYDDVRRFLAASQTVYVPMLLAATGGRRVFKKVGTAEEFFLETANLSQDPRLRRLGLDRPEKIRWRLLEDYHFLAVGRQAAQLASQGAPVAVGTAGKRPGLGLHWELWALEMSGFSPHDALRAATVKAAESLGLGSELGTIEVGKVADLVILDADPIADLKRSQATRYVMRNGELLDATTLAMVWPRATLPLSLRDTRYDPPPAKPRSDDRTAYRTLERSIAPAMTIDTKDTNSNDTTTGLPIKRAQTLLLETREGTFMNLDISPDGETILFNLLGDIYTVPVSGGTAMQLTRGLGVDARPVWSPDGSQIAYVSDASGALGFWVMAADGTRQRLVKELRAELRTDFPELEWSPNGESLVSGDSLFYLAGGTQRLTGVSGPATPPRFSRDGRYRYFKALDSKDVRRYSLGTGDTIQLADPPVNFHQPVVSPDGRWLTYITGAEPANPLAGPQLGDPYNGLRVRDLETGDDRWLAYPVDKRRTNYERYVFTHDSKAVLIGYGGQLHRIDVATGEDHIIPFVAKAKVDLGQQVYNRYQVPSDSLLVRYIRSPSVSPDGKRLVFSALQRLYTMALPAGKPTPLVKQLYGQHQPAYSPDGKWVAYVTWGDVEGGHVWRVPALGGTPQRLTRVAGCYQRPAWSPDGAMLAVLRSCALEINLGALNTASLQLLPSTGGTPRTVATGVAAESPATFTPDGQRLVFQQSGSGDWLVSMRLDGGQRQVLADVSHYGTYVVPSPDTRYVAYVRHDALYVAPVALDTTQRNDAVAPGVRLAHGALDLRWAPDGKTLTWIVGNQVFRIGPEEALAQTPRPIASEVIPIRLTSPRHAVHGILALRGARVITMKGNEVLENGTIVIANGRITAVGPVSSVVIPNNATILDVRGKTLIPGLVDLHAHFWEPRDVFLQSHWKHLTHLAYGVTTARDPSASGTEQFGYAELIESGQRLGPRIFSVGRAMTPDNAQIGSLEDARAVMRHRQAMGVVAVKQYDQPTRRQRQWIFMAAAEAGINVTNESDKVSTLLTMVLDGSTGWEHSPAEVNLYGDLTGLIAARKIWYTPTLQAYYGGNGHVYFRDRYRALYQEPKYKRFVPQEILESRRSDERRLPGHRDYLDFVDVARNAAAVVHRGGNVALGSHGDDQGLGAHWELWALQMGGLTNHEALRVATLGGAEGIGVQQDLGSLEVGKIADILVLDKNPLENIEHSLSIRYVMKNGEVYDGNTLDTVWPKQRALPAWMYQDDPQNTNRLVPSMARRLFDSF